MDYLNILEVHIRLLTKVHNGSKEVEETFETLEGLKHINEVLGGELLVVFGGDLDTHLQVLVDVGLHHGLQTLQGVVHRQGPKKVVDEPVRIEHVRVDHSTLDVVDVRVVLQGALQEPRLLTQLSDVCLILVSEHLVAHDSICHLDEDGGKGRQ